MQPFIVAEQVARGIADFLTTTFPATTPGFDGLMERFVRTPGHLTRGPYVSLGLPFRAAGGEAVPFPWLRAFLPHAHQARAFSRLTGPDARSTLVATGTGSGKTESFLFPVLEHCRLMRAEGRRGIKAILIYPMNALATDQAGRVAREIVTRPELAGITAGLYVGDDSDEQSTTVRHVEGERYSVITDRDRMREEPPDLLLTNYKMLDFLLMRSRDAKLWRHNAPDTLRYLVVDELHAFDGAQGTDLACLIRRLKARLRTPMDTLVCVGTSATLGDGEAVLRDFAGEVFGEPFNDQAIVGEERVSVAEFLRDNAVEYLEAPSAADVLALTPEQYASSTEYLAAQYALWFGESVTETEAVTLAFQIELGRRLKQHVSFQNLLRDIERLGGRAVSVDDLCQVLTRRLRDAADAPAEYPRLWLGSLLALIAHASQETDRPARSPLVTVRVELWLRELRRMVGTLSATPELVHSDDLSAHEPRMLFPVVHCRDCHVMGWGGTQAPTDGAMLRGDLRPFYQAFFSEDTHTRFVFPAEGELPSAKRFVREQACSGCGALNHADSTECHYCSATTLLAVDVANTVKQRTQNGSRVAYASHDCPYCDGDRTLTIVGSQAASLASIALGQLFGTRYNADKKLIAFSDSVQDAAHRAGFFEARNWRLNLRPAIAQVIHAAVDSGAPHTLATLPQAFETRWLPELGEHRYVSTFLPPSLSWMRDYQAMVEQGDAPTNYLRSMLDRALHWSIIGEFAHEAHVGRTLPRTLTASLAFDATALERAAAKAQQTLAEKVDALRDVEVAEVQAFLSGFLSRLLRSGAVWHPQLEQYARGGCNIFRYRHNPAEYALLKHPRRPRFFALLPYGDCTAATGEAAEPYRDWARRAFAGRLELMIDDTMFADIYRSALDALAEVGITRAVEAERSGTFVWGIEPAACQLTAGGRQWRCGTCRNVAVSPMGVDLSGAPCRRLGCRGAYDEYATGDGAFYRQLYLHADVRRILAHEHTGLLERATRERVEHRFREGSINVLSATPTLEMGIDIGDLSSVLLSSVPPSQANYTQRIGRAGRRTGNAFLPTVAVGRPHDLYFWAQPRELLAGQVEAPGIFLNASAVLERQLTAFTIDCWVRETGEPARIPGKLSEVLSAVRNRTESKFPYTWLGFVKTRQGALQDEFTGLFTSNGRTMAVETVAHLEQFLHGDAEHRGMRSAVVDAFDRVNRDLDDLKRRRTRIETEIARIEALPARGESEEEERRALRQERSALTALMASINGRDTLQFLTDTGLVPNYAFPEQGVLLHSVIVRDDRKREDDDRVLTFEYERPGASAITELAPNNVFYAQGRRVTIDQVDIAHDNKPAEWRFCRHCSYTEEEALGSAHEHCPRCGDTMWSDAGRVQQMMRLTKVYAHSFESRSRISDDADDRERRFFARQALVDVDPLAVRQAWTIENEAMPFAFEFASRIKFREVNFGEQDADGLPIKIAGNETPKAGFRICRECGTIQRRRSAQDAWKNHALYCPQRKQTGPVTEACVFLYREFESEGLRAYLPESTFAVSESAVLSFIAALQMGLELKFRGSVDHLRIARDVRIAEGNELPRQYLVIYDSIPGGTGYLKELMRDASPLFEVFEHALRRLETCGCNADDTKDGCYRCLYTYHNSHERVHVSRRTAVRVLKQLLEHQGSLREIKSLADLAPRNSLFDSALEARFIEALRRRPADGVRFEVRDEVVRGKAGYSLRAGERLWLIEPQVSLGSADGVVVPCKPDFVLWPEAATGCRPIAVFMDGWQYHKDRIGDDVTKRLAVARSGKFAVWTLTADDITHVLEPGAPVPEMLWSQAFGGDDANAAKLYERFGIEAWRRFHARTAFEQLRERLAVMTDADVERVAIALAVRAGGARFVADDFSSLKASPAHESIVQSGVFEWPTAPEVGRCVATVDGGIELGIQARKADLACLPARASERAVQPTVVARWCVPATTDDREARAAWQRWWHALNVLFSMSNSWAATDEGTDLTALSGAPAYAATSRNTEWEAVARLALGDVQPLLGELAVRGLPLPEVGFELLGPDGRVVAESEIAWPSHKLAVTIGEPEPAWLEHGWTARACSESALADRIASLITS